MMEKHECVDSLIACSGNSAIIYQIGEIYIPIRHESAGATVTGRIKINCKYCPFCGTRLGDHEPSPIDKIFEPLVEADIKRIVNSTYRPVGGGKG